jgi:hypothetical protein
MRNKTLLKFLEQNKFVGGDISIEISLMEYGQVSKMVNDRIIVCYYSEFNKQYDYTVIYKHELLDDLNNMSNSFWQFIDQSKNDIQINTIYEINDLIYSLNLYAFIYKQSCIYLYSMQRIIEILKNEIKNS